MRALLYLFLYWQIAANDADDIWIPGLDYPDVEEADKDALAASLAALGALAGVFVFKYTRRWAIDVTEPRRRIMSLWWMLANRVLCRESSSRFRSDILQQKEAKEKGDLDLVDITSRPLCLRRYSSGSLSEGGLQDVVVIEFLAAQPAVELLSPEELTSSESSFPSTESVSCPAARSPSVVSSYSTTVLSQSLLRRYPSCQSNFSVASDLFMVPAPLPPEESEPMKLSDRVERMTARSVQVQRPIPPPKTARPTNAGRSQPWELPVEPWLGTCIPEYDERLEIAFHIAPLHRNYHRPLCSFDAETDGFLRSRVADHAAPHHPSCKHCSSCCCVICQP
eukprot:Protomagalhaensia_wolfi_Nauph_80__5612@NODE_63_length_4088_cov_50_951840_g52_i0_p2_GENE_NODE_63_length_4088_cov_50_951840_g52_i0NODE_63_length_4088_cov_50_951840_g52_i0_p2_ORF_typecomplete_len337_score25_44CoatB/PF10389_9/0_013_NODE_63_length_4088_cov_50_951840_g52_i07381748